LTPTFKGDLKRSQNQFHMPPVVTEDLVQTKYSRNIWVIPKGGDPWSATGVSADSQLREMKGQADSLWLNVVPGSFSVTRNHFNLALRATVTMFVPSDPVTCEVMIVELENLSDQSMTVDVVPAIPLYARSADNLRDHRQVTTLLNRIVAIPGGHAVKPTMSFDERGHRLNHSYYSVQQFDENGRGSDSGYTRLMAFVGSGSLETPEAIYHHTAQSPSTEDGREAIAAYRFENYQIAPNGKISFVVINGITEDADDFKKWQQAYGTLEKAREAHQSTIAYWQARLNKVCYETGHATFDGWMKWVSWQPMARKVYGCSFLPDFGYGRGGRGWRDLWQDCLALILTNPSETTDLLFNNFAGIRADGSNATIIGSKPGEFIADRNAISRTWMDHGVWPLVTTAFYLNQSGDLDFLLRQQRYFKDGQAHRSKEKDLDWQPDQGSWLKDASGNVYEGSIFEHLLLQTVTQFYNVGAHNICRLEDADWNDGLDMAHEKGESVAFHCMYARHLSLLADLLGELQQKKGISSVTIFEEMTVLLSHHIDYQNPEQRRDFLRVYMDKIRHSVSGKTLDVSIETLQKDLREKSAVMIQTVMKNELLNVSGNRFFNGYYNNDGQRVEGDFPEGLRMTLTGQVFPIMAGLGDDQLVDSVFESAKAYLQDKRLGGFRLNTDFGGPQMNLGRAFSFSYGDKENGAFFSHMIVMFMYGLYARGHVAQAYEVFLSVFNMSNDFEKAKILPGLPEYIDGDGRGAYLYLTGSASWMVLTVATQMFGVRGVGGRLCVSPKLTAAQFLGDELKIHTTWQGQRLTVTYQNSAKLEYGQYRIAEVWVNGVMSSDIEFSDAAKTAFVDLVSGRENEILVRLG